MTVKQEPDPTFDLEKLPRWLRDSIDLNNEMTASQTGRETSRAKRFIPDDHPDSPEQQRREKERRFDALMRRLMDPAYAALYISTAETITRAEDAALRAAARIALETKNAGERLDAMRVNAATLPDGRKVFRAANGRVYSEDGSDVTALKSTLNGGGADAPSWEEFKRAKDWAAELERERLEIERYREDVIEPAKTRLADGDDPPTEQELREITKRLEEAMPPRMRSEYDETATEQSSSKPAAEHYMGSAKLDGPDLALEFKAAHDGPATGSGPGPKLSPS